MALAGVAQWIECRLQTKGSQVGFPVMGYAWVCRPGPQWGPCERQPHIDVFLPLSPPPPLSLKIKTKKKKKEIMRENKPNIAIV